ncbi:hypothetical protein QTG54_008841 [Skeletonema marinoi]|uniref:Uncharacterized protein n=1 Tax=Skeletonema marinoi TaxID=267567 RepID=A0AAD8Y8K0_9STRA|nr:hypothetical protein QTG54_008841 [Skeletonema marinoi]
MPIIIPKQKEGDAASPASTDESKAIAAAAAAKPSPVPKRYNTILRDFMAYHHQTTMYQEGHTFADAELLEITPDHIIRYFTMKLYGDGDVVPQGKPLKGSHHTLDYYKKAISSFIPNKQQPWDNAIKKGNPTRAKVVNKFIHRIRELEGDEGSSKKRKSGETPIQAIKSPSSLPTSSTAKKARVDDQSNVGGNSNAIISSILQKMQLQNSLTVDFIGTLSTSLNGYRSTLQENNQSITAELQRLNNSLQQTDNISVPPAPVPAASVPTLPPVAAAAVPGVASLPQSAPLVVPAQEQRWFYNHPDGSQRRVPPSWKFPSGTLLELYTLWHLGDPQNQISPMKYFSTSDVSFCGKRSRMSLSEARGLANALDKEVIKAGRSISPNMSQAELVELFRFAVNGIDMPLQTPTGRQRDIFRLKWSTFTKYKINSKEEENSEEVEGLEATQLTYAQVPIVQDAGNWLYEHADGEKRKVPSTWTFPMVSLRDIYVLWNCRNENQKIVPMKSFTSKDVSFLQKGSKNLAEVRGMMNVISKEAASKGFEIKEVMTTTEALNAFSAGVGALNIPLLTPQGKARDIARTKWSSASRFKNLPSETEKAAETAC